MGAGRAYMRKKKKPDPKELTARKKAGLEKAARILLGMKPASGSEGLVAQRMRGAAMSKSEKIDELVKQRILEAAGIVAGPIASAYYDEPMAPPSLGDRTDNPSPARDLTPREKGLHDLLETVSAIASSVVAPKMQRVREAITEELGLVSPKTYWSLNTDTSFPDPDKTPWNRAENVWHMKVPFSTTVTVDSVDKPFNDMVRRVSDE